MTQKEWYGIDVNLETSLGEYQLIGKRDEDGDTLFYYYDQMTESYQTATLSDAEVNENFTDMDEDEKESFLNYLGLTFEEWDTSTPVQKVMDLLSHMTTTDIFGSSYFKGDDLETVLKRITEESEK